MGYANGSPDGNIIGMRSGKPEYLIWCEIELNDCSCGKEVGKEEGGKEAAIGDGWTRSVTNASDTMETGSFGNSRVEAIHDGALLKERLSSRLFGLLLDSGTVGRGTNCVGNVLARFGGGPGSEGVCGPRPTVGGSEGTGRLRLTRFLEFCRFFSRSGRFLKRHYISTVSLPKNYYRRRRVENKERTVRLCEHRSAAMLFLASPASVAFPSIASFRTPSLAVGESGFSRTKKINDRIAK